jgi:hypothetical protein
MAWESDCGNLKQLYERGRLKGDRWPCKGENYPAPSALSYAGIEARM